MGDHYSGGVIDARLLRTDPDRIRRSQQRRGESVDLVDQLISVDESRRQSISSYETARAEQKELSKQIPKAQGEERQALLAKTKQLSEQVKAAEATQRETEAEFHELLLDRAVTAARLRSEELGRG